MKLFLDTSALAKRYVNESGTESLLTYCQKAEVILISVLTTVEMISTLTRCRRENRLSRRQYLRLKQEFAKDLEEMHVVNLSDSVISLSIKCLENNPSKTLDSVQVACAVDADVDLFLTSDKQQARAAKQMKLRVGVC